MPLAITIKERDAVVDYTEHLSAGSLRVMSELGGPATAMFTLHDLTASRQPGIGSEIRIEQTVAGQPARVLFVGQVDKLVKRKIPGTGIIEHEVNAVDYSCVLSRRVYSGTIPTGVRLSAAVAQILSASMAGEQVTLGAVDAITLTSKVQFTSLPVLDCLNELARLTAAKWWVTPTKQLTFKARSTDSAPWVLNNHDDYRDLTIERERSQYRNVQYILGPRVDVKTPTVMQWTSDGQQRSFSITRGTVVSGTRYDEIASVDSWVVEIDETQTDPEKRESQRLIGAPGTANVDYTYEVGSAVISVAPGKTPPKKGIKLKATIHGRYRVVGQAPSTDKIPTDPEVIARRSWEGGTGRYEMVEVDESIPDSGTANAKAQALRALHGHIPTIISFVTYRPGLQTGQNLRIDLTNLSLNSDYLIDSVEIIDERTAEEAYRIRYHVRCVGSEVPKWQGYFAALLKAREAPKTEAWDEYQADVYAPVDVLHVSDALSIVPLEYADAEVGPGDGTLRAPADKSWPGSMVVGAGTDSASQLMVLLFGGWPAPTVPPLEAQATVGFCEVS